MPSTLEIRQAELSQLPEKISAKQKELDQARIDNPQKFFVRRGRPRLKIPNQQIKNLERQLESLTSRQNTLSEVISSLERTAARREERRDSIEDIKQARRNTKTGDITEKELEVKETQFAAKFPESVKKPEIVLESRKKIIEEGVVFDVPSTAKVSPGFLKNIGEKAKAPTSDFFKDQEAKQKQFEKDKKEFAESRKEEFKTSLLQKQDAVKLTKEKKQTPPPKNVFEDIVQDTKQTAKVFKEEGKSLAASTGQDLKKASDKFFTATTGKDTKKTVQQFSESVLQPVSKFASSIGEDVIDVSKTFFTGTKDFITSTAKDVIPSLDTSLKGFEKRVEATKKREDEFFSSPGFQRIENVASFLTLGGGKQKEERSSVGRVAQSVTSGLLSAPIAIGGAIPIVAEKTAQTIEAAFRQETRQNVLPELKRAGKETGKLFDPRTPEGREALASAIITSAVFAIPGASAKVLSGKGGFGTENLRFNVEKFDLPGKKGPQTQYKGVTITSGKEGRPLIGIQEGKPVVGTPKVDLSKGEFSSGFIVESPAQTRILESNLLSVLSKEEAAKFPLFREVVKSTEKTPSKFLVEKFKKETKTLNPQGVEDVLQFTKDQDGFTYGSFAAKQQGVQRLPGDIDVQLKVSTEAAKPAIQELISNLRKSGNEVRLAKGSETLIEVKGEGGKYHHAVDIHTTDTLATDILSPDFAVNQAFGFDLNQPKLKLEGVNVQKLSEQGVRKAASIFTVRTPTRSKFQGLTETEIKQGLEFHHTDYTKNIGVKITKEQHKLFHNIDSGKVKANTPELKAFHEALKITNAKKPQAEFAPLPHRGKDIPDFFETQEVLLESKFIKDIKAETSLKRLKELFPKELTKAQSNVKVELSAPSKSQARPPTFTSSPSSRRVEVSRASKGEPVFFERVEVSPPSRTTSPSRSTSAPSFDFTPSKSSSPSRSRSPSQPASPSPSPSKGSPSFSLSPSPSPSPGSKSPSPSPSPSLSPSPSISPSPSPSPSKSPSRSPSPSPSPPFDFFDKPRPSAAASFGSPSSRSPGGGLFSVKVRRFGVFNEVASFTSAKEAFLRGVQVVQHTAAASFKIDPIGTAQTDISVLSRSILPGTFRKSKKEKGVFIEKREARISTGGEKLEITLKGIQASKSKRKKKSVFKL